MFELFERLPEWVRWVLFIPALLTFIIINGLLMRVINYEMSGTFIFEKIFFPALSAMFIVVFASMIIPRGKVLLSYILCFLWALLVLLALFAIFILPPADGALTWRELVQCCFGLVGAVFGVRFVRNER